MSAKRPKLEDPPREAETPDPLEPYRTALADLEGLAVKLAALRAEEPELRGTNARLQEEREKCLSSDSDECVEELSRLNARLEITQRRISAKALEIEQAGETLAGEISTVCVRFQGLWRAYRGWKIESEKKRLLAQMTPGSDCPATDWVTLHLLRVAEIGSLGIASSEAVGLAEQCSKLLDAISGEAEFPVPSYVPPVVPAEPEIGSGPWLGCGMTAQEIAGELKCLRLEHPDLDLAGIYRKLYEKHPELFRSPEEVLKMNEPLPMREMIGSTYVPDDARLSEVLNS
jgi:hypothetical protein